MGIKTIPLKKWLKYLKDKGLVFVRKESSHHIYNYPEGTAKLFRPVTVDVNYKDVPIQHIHTSLKTLGVDKAIFEKEIKKF